MTNFSLCVPISCELSQNEEGRHTGNTCFSGGDAVVALNQKEEGGHWCKGRKETFSEMSIGSIY